MSLRERLAPARLRRGLETPSLLAREANRLYHTHLGRRSHNLAGIDVFAADWDTLAIADACRYDTFAVNHTLPGRLEARTSRGSSTTEWLHANFTGDHRDTVYVTANPQYESHREALDIKFCEVVDLRGDDAWDEESQTVRPETVTAAALNVADRYPNKRLLVHYIQPHYPFVGPTGREHLGRSPQFWTDVITGGIDVPDAVLRKANLENFELMLPALADLLDGREGRTVVSADHGQLLGERSFPIPIREYGHPRQTYVEELVRVPWLVHDHGERPEITASETSAHKSDSDDVEDRLEALGYA
jgi:hypothetical protein